MIDKTKNYRDIANKMEEVRVYIDERTSVGRRALKALDGCALPLCHIPSSGVVEIVYGCHTYMGVGQIRRFVEWTKTLEDIPYANFRKAD